ALRGILDAGGDITHEWDLQQAFKIGDKATNTTVLSDLYTQMKDKAVTTDLAAIWQDLGVVGEGKSVRLIDTAPSAAIRRAITAPPTQTHAALRSVLAGRASAPVSH